MRLLGNSFEHVEDKAYNLIMPILSYWSYKYNVAVDIAGYEVLHECSQTRKTSMAILGQTRYLDVDDAFQLAPELRLLFAAFRKGLCANDVFYQALSFYKVIEGVGRLRAKRRKALLETGETPRAEREMFPSTLEAIPLADPFGFAKLGFTLYLGKKFSWAKEQFRPLIRNAIAHLDPTKDNGDVIDADSFSDWIQCREAVPIMWYMASNMLDSEIQHLAGSQNTANFGPSSGTHSRLV